MSKDEAFDGAKHAAQILSHMAPERQQRIMQRMREREPELTQVVEHKMFTFEDIADLTPQGIQVLINEVDQKDLVLSLKGASDRVSQAFLNNVTERKQQILMDDLEALGPTPKTEVDAAKSRILKAVDELRTQGRLRSSGDSDVWV